MPEREVGLARFPAEKDAPAVPHGRKVQQPEVDVLDDTAVRLDASDRPHDLALEAFGLREGRPRRPAEIALEEQDREATARQQQLVDQRSDLRDEGADGFGRKKLHDASRIRTVTFARFVVVGGLSGAGKSQAMKSFEDLGFTCLDGVPPALLSDVVALAERTSIERLALVLDGRTGGAFGDPAAALATLHDRGIVPDVLFLEATDETILRRYSETRRRHPFAGAGSLAGSVEQERAEVAPLRALATHVWDTSHLTQGALKARIAAVFGDRGPATEALAVRVVAFGFKYGVPLDADLVFDVRFLPNPNYVAELKALDGRDLPVARFLQQLPATNELLERVESLLDFLVPQYANEGKSRLTIAIGCTGGRHRSVYVAGRLAEHLRNRCDVRVDLDLRELAGALTPGRVPA